MIILAIANLKIFEALGAKRISVNDTRVPKQQKIFLNLHRPKGSSKIAAFYGTSRRRANFLHSLLIIP
jgi:hypothetical protein